MDQQQKEQQQKILGYFIEEAKEHLETLERGFLNLSAMIKDTERVNEMFRAAHSIKGGAAMLGYGSIQKIAHRLEDSLKILRENQVNVDQKLESLFLKGYDVLQDLIEKLQSPFGLSQEEGDKVVAEKEANFIQLQQHLKHLLGGAAAPGSEVVPGAATAAALAAQVKVLLREMLQLFQQPNEAVNRKKLEQICDKLAKIAPEITGWQTLTATARKALSNPKHQYRTLAPVIIQELKQGSDLIILGRAEKIAPSQELQQLASSTIPQILVPAEPKALAKLLLQVFNQQQLSQVVELIAPKT